MTRFLPNICFARQPGTIKAIASIIGIDPVGNRVSVNQSIVGHILKDAAKRHDGREAYFPFIPETIEKPAEIWVGFSNSEATGRVRVRRRYVRMVGTSKGRTVGLVADLDEGDGGPASRPFGAALPPSRISGRGCACIGVNDGAYSPHPDCGARQWPSVSGPTLPSNVRITMAARQRSPNPGRHLLESDHGLRRPVRRGVHLSQGPMIVAVAAGASGRFRRPPGITT